MYMTKKKKAGRFQNWRPARCANSLRRLLGANSSDAELAEMEKTLLQRINGLNIGCQGFHGNTTAIGVAIEKAPTHIAGLPVAVNIQCHCVRCVKEEI